MTVGLVEKLLVVLGIGLGFQFPFGLELDVTPHESQGLNMCAEGLRTV